MVPDGFDARGDPVGRPWGTGDLPAAWVQVAAVFGGSNRQHWSVVGRFLAANDGRAADVLGIDPGLSRLVQRRGNGRAEPVTASAGSREGQALTYAVLDESFLWTRANGGHKLAAILRRNVGKMGGRTYETTNAYVPGEDSVAERTDRAIEKGEAGIFCDAVEAPHVVRGVDVDEDAPDAILRDALDVAYAGCWWIDRDRLVADIRDPDSRWEDSARFFFNWNRRAASAFIDPIRWASLARHNGPPKPRTRIGIGFDGSISQDSTALYGCTENGYLFEIATWERPPDAEEWHVPRLEVRDALRTAFRRYKVARMYADPPKWWTELEEWAAKWGAETVLALDTNQAKRFAPACDRFLTAVTSPDESLTHDGGEGLTAHLAACARKPVRLADDASDGRSRFVILKADTRKIDRAVAAILAYEAARSMGPRPKAHVYSMAELMARAGV